MSDNDIEYEEDEAIISPFKGFRSHEFGSPSVESLLSSFFLVFLTLLSIALYLTSKLEHCKHKGQILQERNNRHNAKHWDKIKGTLYTAAGRYVPEAGLVIAVGVFAGFVVCYLLPTDQEVGKEEGSNSTSTSSEPSEPSTIEDYLLQFSPTTFFLLLLPPIIFNSGYHMNRTLFYPLLPAISMYAILGTAVSAAVIGVGLHTITERIECEGFKPTLSETLAFGALISATDPVSTLAVFQSKRVDPTLFYLVFGESVLNDAVGLVMYETLRKFVGISHNGTSVSVAILDFAVIFLCSTLLGLACGILASWFVKIVDARENVLIECGLFSLVVYLPFLVAEVLSMSGIVTILFTGIMCKCYGAKNLSDEGRDVMDAFFRILAHLAETSIFLQLGLSVFGLTSTSPGALNVTFVSLTLLLCLFSRALNVYPISWFLNSCVYESSPSGSKLVQTKTQHMLYLSGLRGAVAFACAQTFPDDYDNRGVFVVTTMCVVLVTTGVMGGGTESMLEALRIETGVDEDCFDGSSIPKPRFGGGGLKRIHKWIGRWTVRDFGIDVLGGEAEGRDSGEGLEMQEGRTLVLHDSMKGNGTTLGGSLMTPRVAGGGDVGGSVVRSVGSVGSVGSGVTAASRTSRSTRGAHRRDSSRNIFDFGVKKTPKRDSEC